MKLGSKVKEKLARTIAEYFTTNEIVSVFTDAGIPTDISLFAKWKITLDAFSKVATEEGFFHILAEFCHPLSFNEPSQRLAFVSAIRKILSYEDIETQMREKDVLFVLSKNGNRTVISEPTPKAKTSTDYIVEALNFFKDEYNKVRINGLTYEYSIGENIKSEQTDQDYDDYSSRLSAIKRLHEAGFITEYNIEERVENEGYYIWDYAICKIDENKITQKEEPRATDAGVESIVQKIVHEHTHRFENSIQEKGIDLHHKFDNQKETGIKYYITKKDDDFFYKGRYINLSKKADYYKVFSALYALLPDGGEVSYADLIKEVKSRIPKTKNKSEAEMRKFIQGNITEKGNGFARYSGIPETEDNGKPLIEVIRSNGIAFNNKIG